MFMPWEMFSTAGAPPWNLDLGSRVPGLGCAALAGRSGGLQSCRAQARCCGAWRAWGEEVRLQERRMKSSHKAKEATKPQKGQVLYTGQPCVSHHWVGGGCSVSCKTKQNKTKQNKTSWDAWVA